MTDWLYSAGVGDGVVADDVHLAVARREVSWLPDVKRISVNKNPKRIRFPTEEYSGDRCTCVGARDQFVCV